MFTIGEIDPGATIATFVGPVVAVGITLWLQARDRARDRKELLLRQILATRLTPADPAFNVAVTLIPVEFRAHAAVRTAHRDFIAAANRSGPTDIQDKQSALILAMMQVLGVRTESARDAVRDPYSSVALANWQKMQADALSALPKLVEGIDRLAAASEESAELLRSNLAAGPAAAPKPDSRYPASHPG